MAFGDQMNDYTFIKICQYSYAMANAVPRIKDIAYGIHKSNDHRVINIKRSFKSKIKCNSLH